MTADADVIAAMWRCRPYIVNAMPAHLGPVPSLAPYDKILRSAAVDDGMLPEFADADVLVALSVLTEAERLP